MKLAREISLLVNTCRISLSEVTHLVKWILSFIDALFILIHLFIYEY